MTVAIAIAAALLALAGLLHVLRFYGHQPPVPVAVEPSWRQPADETHLHVYEEAA